MSPNMTKRLLLLVSIGGLLAAGSAWALKSDKSQPINIHSDHADFKADSNNTSNGTGIYTGHVVIVQGSIVINADKAVFHVVNNELDTADITGNPATFVQQPDQGEPMHGEAQEITYDVPRNEIVLINNAKLAQQVIAHVTKSASKGDSPGERIMTADHIRYNTDTQHVIAKSGDQQERVHISFPPKTTAPVSGTGAAAAKSKAPAAASTALGSTAGKSRAAPTVLAPRPSTAPTPATTPAGNAASQSGPP